MRPGISRIGDEEAALNHEFLLFASQLTGDLRKDKSRCDCANQSNPEPLKELKKMAITPMVIGISLADDDIKSGKMIDQCKLCISKSGTKRWVGTPDTLRVAQNKKWKTAAGNSIANHINFASTRNPQNLFV
jgi:hypothetical protein